MTAEIQVEAVDLAKTYGAVRAVDGISFAITKGEMFGLLGPNGAGKSTTLRMLTTLVRPTSGTAQVNGYDVLTHRNEVRRAIGVVFQEQTLDPQLTAAETLRFHAVLHGMARRRIADRIDHVLGLAGLQDRRDSLVRTFSGGLARRLELARALMHVPLVLFLDEPTVGLDPESRVLLWRDLHRLREEEGVTVVVNTHDLAEAENADRIAIIDHGRVVALDTPSALKGRIGHDTVRIVTADQDRAVRRLSAAGLDARAANGAVLVHVEDAESRVAEIVGHVNDAVTHVSVQRPTLDDVFIAYAGRANANR